ncbi:MAG: hypothetical protein PHX34_05425, partial [Candidatus Shapirobacteria bacterium]|nr:hypothetical protein [Candidatus Shapirobacteria bacterium]
MDWSLNIEEIGLITQSSFIKKRRDELYKLLIDSRKRLTPEKLLNLQFEIANKIILAEKEISYFSESANRNKHNSEWYTRELHKMVRNILKSIADGIAWRYLNFDRARLRKMADHPQVGHLKKGTIDEMKEALEIVKLHPDCHIILNDITNCLRYGDLTVIDKKNRTYYIDEVKGGIAKDSRKIKQKNDLKKLLDMFNSKKIIIGDKVADLVKTPGQITNFLEVVHQLIKEAKVSKSGILSKRLSPYIWIECIVTDTYFENIKKGEKVERLDPPFTNKDYYFIPLDSISTLDQYGPILAPWSV